MIEFLYLKNIYFILLCINSIVYLHIKNETGLYNFFKNVYSYFIDVLYYLQVFQIRSRKKHLISISNIHLIISIVKQIIMILPKLDIMLKTMFGDTINWLFHFLIPWGIAQKCFLVL